MLLLDQFACGASRTDQGRLLEHGRHHLGRSNRALFGSDRREEQGAALRIVHDREANRSSDNDRQPLVGIAERRNFPQEDSHVGDDGLPVIRRQLFPGCNLESSRQIRSADMRLYVPVPLASAPQLAGVSEDEVTELRLAGLVPTLGEREHSTANASAEPDVDARTPEGHAFTKSLGLTITENHDRQPEGRHEVLLEVEAVPARQIARAGDQPLVVPLSGESNPNGRDSHSLVHHQLLRSTDESTKARGVVASVGLEHDERDKFSIHEYRYPHPRTTNVEHQIGAHNTPFPGLVPPRMGRIYTYSSTDSLESQFIQKDYNFALVVR